MDLMPIYSVPVWQGEYSNLSEEKDKLLTAVEEYKEENPQTTQGNNFNGYESPGFLHEKTDLEGLLTYICEFAGKAAAEIDLVRSKVFISSTWVNYNGKNSFIAPHAHNDVFSGVFYLSAPEGSGKLCIQNPAINHSWGGKRLIANKNEFTADTLKVEPIEGQVYMWPSYIQHYVEPGENEEDRISISFTIHLEPIFEE